MTTRLISGHLVVFWLSYILGRYVLLAFSILAQTNYLPATSKMSYMAAGAFSE